MSSRSEDTKTQLESTSVTMTTPGSLPATVPELAGQLNQQILPTGGPVRLSTLTALTKAAKSNPLLSFFHSL